MHRCAFTFLALCSFQVSRPASSVVAQRIPTTSKDPIVGVWTLDTISGEKMEYVITVYADGTTNTRMSGEDIPGTWKRFRNGRYAMEPGGEDDYVILRNGRLEEWDKTGFIRSLKRVPPPKPLTRVTTSTPTRQDAQTWAYSVFTPGMWWKANTARDFVQHMGPYQIIPAKVPHYKAYYFTQADLTILVDEERGVAMQMRQGRAAQ